MKILDKISLILVIIGALNWGSVALFKADFVLGIFGASISKFIYVLVCLAGLWCITLLFRHREYD